MSTTTTTSPVSLLALHAAAIASRGSDAERVAADALVRAMVASEDGPQGDGSWVTSRRARIWDAESPVVYELHAPARAGVLATARVLFPSEGEMEIESSVLCSREEARSRREELRAERRAGQARYEARRLEAGVLLAGGGALCYESGQEGGVVILSDGARVSARGALRAAGVIGAAAEEVLDLVLAKRPDNLGRRVLYLPPRLRMGKPVLRGRGRRGDLRIVVL